MRTDQEMPNPFEYYSKDFLRSKYGIKHLSLVPEFFYNEEGGIFGITFNAHIFGTKTGMIGLPRLARTVGKDIAEGMRLVGDLKKSGRVEVIQIGAAAYIKSGDVYNLKSETQMELEIRIQELISEGSIEGHIAYEDIQNLFNGNSTRSNIKHLINIIESEYCVPVITEEQDEKHDKEQETPVRTFKIPDMHESSDISDNHSSAKTETKHKPKGPLNLEQVLGIYKTPENPPHLKILNTYMPKIQDMLSESKKGVREKVSPENSIDDSLLSKIRKEVPHRYDIWLAGKVSATQKINYSLVLGDLIEANNSSAFKIDCENKTLFYQGKKYETHELLQEKTGRGRVYFVVEIDGANYMIKDMALEGKYTGRPSELKLNAKTFWKSKDVDAKKFHSLGHLRNPGKIPIHKFDLIYSKGNFYVMHLSHLKTEGKYIITEVVK